MDENTFLKKTGFLSTGIVAAAALRIWMAHLPNIEPIMLFTIVAGLSAGPVAGLLMGAGSMILSNLLMLPGPHTFAWILHMPLVTIYTSLSYGVIGILCGLLGLVKKEWGCINLGLLAGISTLFYDGVTCVLFAIQFYGPAGIPAALSMQVPFTIMHLTNVIFVMFFAPYMFKILNKAYRYSFTEFLQKQNRPTQIR